MVVDEMGSGVVSVSCSVFPSKRHEFQFLETG